MPVSFLMAPDRIKQQTVVAQVMDEIRNLIASGAYSPGDKIPTEKEMAERFGIGRSSIREAVKIFNYLGILESKAALGTFVRERSSISSEALTWSLLLGNDELEEIIDFRGAIEMWCLIKLADAVREDGVAGRQCVRELQAIVDDMELASAAGRRDALKADDYRFHYEIIRSARTPLFTSIYETLRSFLQDEIGKSQDDYDDPRQIYREHEHLLGAIRKGNRAELIIDYIGHIRNIKERLEKPRKPSSV